MNLTIIIPTFNSKEYIEETLKSLKDIINICEGGAIIVDDGSVDNTLKILSNLKKKYNLKIVSLKKNKGAGYAKDYGIKLSNTKFFLVCDSDNIYNKDSIKKLYDSLNKNNLDAAHFQKGFHFFDRNKSKIDHVCDWYQLLNKNEFNTLKKLLKFNVLLDNFMMSKKSYLLSEGYPINHGFDTQGLSINYLLKNSKIKIIKNTYYFHRRFKKKKSYYERENHLNRASINYYLIYEKLIKFKKDILIKFFDLKIFDNSINLNDYLYLKANLIKSQNKQLIIKNQVIWYKFFESQKYSKLIPISIELIKLTNFSDLSVYLLIRSIFYNFKGKKNENDIESFELLRNFYKKRDYRSLKEKLYFKIFSYFKK